MTKKNAAILIFITIMTCSFVWVRLQIVRISYDINELAKQEHAVQEGCNGLSLRINEARSPHRLEKLAKTKFNMQPPRPEQRIVLSSVSSKMK